MTACFLRLALPAALLLANAAVAGAQVRQSPTPLPTTPTRAPATNMAQINPQTVVVDPAKAEIEQLKTEVGSLRTEIDKLKASLEALRVVYNQHTHSVMDPVFLNPKAIYPGTPISPGYLIAALYCGTSVDCTNKINKTSSGKAYPQWQ